VISAAEITNADAIHPGYGFLSENADFAEVCETSGIKFIGPKPDVIRAMGLKQHARAIDGGAGVPILPGSEGFSRARKKRSKRRSASDIPVMLKASAGGGGRGMRVVHRAPSCRQPAGAGAAGSRRAFSSATFTWKSWWSAAAHRVSDAGRRARQRRDSGRARMLHPAAASEADRRSAVARVTPGAARARFEETAARAIKAIGYTNAGTVEFLMDRAGNLYFIEVNARIQVEHPVTEWSPASIW
jgi:acetyl-CoA carboxylase biotin carboxylase subunit